MYNTFVSFSVKKQINSGKLRFISSLSLCVVVVLIVFVLTNSVMNHSLQREKQKYFESCYAVLDGYSNAVLFYLKNYRTSLESIYDERLLKSGDADKIQQWVKMNKPLLHKDFLRLFFIDKNGIAHIEDDMVIDVSQKEYFIEIKPVNNMINISNIYYTENEKGPVVVISIPYVNEKNEIVFVLAASMYVSSLRKIVDNIKIGGDCEMYLLDRHGRFLLNPNEALIGKTFTPSEERYSSVSTTYIASYERGYVETKNSKGELVDLFYTKLPESEWTFTVGFPRYTLTKIYNQENWERIAIIVISVLSILVLVFLQNKIINYFYQRQTIEIEYDSLTNLFTRQKFESIATKLIKQSPNQKFMLIESDIRGFKFINQNYGEEAADKLIYYYSTLINRTTKMYKGIVGRGYADHFYSLMKVKNVNSSMRKFKADLNNLLEVIKNYDIPFFPKFGIVFVRADSSKNISMRELIGQASFAKSSIKYTMTDSYAIYNSRIVNKMNEIQMIERTAESALSNEEFYVLYQPKILLANDKIVGAEALVRWKTKDGKFYTPDKFIPLFEQNGFITKLDFFVYEKVFQFLDKRIKNGENVVTISLNMSRNHNRPDKFMNEFMGIFNKYDIPAKYVQVEIIERSVMDETTLREITDRLHKNGFTVAMDDFGSGESSLNMLTKVPVDVLKFDRDFLLSSTKEDGSLTEKSEKFIQSLLELSRNLEKETVFEGVETESQRDFLKRAYCDQVQGYFYSKPLSEEDFVEFMNSHL